MILGLAGRLVTVAVFAGFAALCFDRRMEPAAAVLALAALVLLAAQSATHGRRDNSGLRSAKEAVDAMAGPPHRP